MKINQILRETVYVNIKTYESMITIDTTGKERTWHAEVGWNDENDAAYRTISGLVDGAKVTSNWTVTFGKNIGRSNETTALEQAKREVESLYQRRKERYSKPFDPMLAQTYKEMTWLEVVSQPKLDGIRCVTNSDGMWSRAGKAIVSCPHIFRQLNQFFNRFPEAILDGELYSHDLHDDFNKLTSLIRKTKPTSADLAETERVIEYHVYDVLIDGNPERGFLDRWDQLTGSNVNMPKSVKLVKTTKVSSQEELDALYAEYLEDGYEGQMVRNPEGNYEHKRSKNLLKRKDFKDAEFDVVDVEEGTGNWSGMVKKFVFDYDGKPFKAGVRGSQETLRKLWKERQRGRIPDWATVRYQNITPTGVPRIGIVVDWGYGKRND